MLEQLYSEMFFVIITVVLLLMEPLTVSAVEEEAISINKPILRNQEPWVQFSVQFSTDYVRCFCNLPACVSTGYMCKSSGGGCFSDLLGHTMPRSTVYRGRHGCLELLTDKEQRKWCEHDVDNTKPPQKNKKHPKSLFLCCHHDMCNHVDSPQTKNLINNTLLSDILDEPDNRPPGNRPENFLYSNSEVWFRAATIAVPICGAVILFVLIALAVKILRSENQNSTNNKLGPALHVHQMPSRNKSSYACEKYQPQDNFDRAYDDLLRKQFPPTHHQNTFYCNGQEEVVQKQIQVPLLVQNEINTHHCGNKNETNAKLNLMQCDSVENYLESGKNIILQFEKDSDSNSEINIVKNINNGEEIVDKFSKEKS